MSHRPERIGAVSRIIPIVTLGTQQTIFALTTRENQLGGDGLRSSGALELEDGLRLCCWAAEAGGCSVTMALAQLCVHACGPEPCCDDGAAMLLWHPGAYRAFCMLYPAAMGQSQKIMCK